MDHPVYISGYFESGNDIVLSKLAYAMISACMPVLMTSRNGDKTRIYFENCGYSSFEFCRKAIEYVAEETYPYLCSSFPLSCKGTWLSGHDHGTFEFDGCIGEFRNSDRILLNF